MLSGLAVDVDVDWALLVQISPCPMSLLSCTTPAACKQMTTQTRWEQAGEILPFSFTQGACQESQHLLVIYFIALRTWDPLLPPLRLHSFCLAVIVFRQSIIAEVENSLAAQYAAMPQEELHQWHATLQQSLSESSDAHHKAKDYLKQVTPHAM